MADKLNVLLLVGGPGGWYHDQPFHREMLNTLSLRACFFWNSVL